MRTWRRLHRAAAEQERRRGPSSPLTGAQVRHWSALASNTPLPGSQAEALGRANQAIMQCEERQRRERSARWRREFRQDASNATGAGSRSLKLHVPPDPDLTSASMTQEWNPLWNAVLPDAEQRWQEVLRRAPGGAADEPLSLEFCPVSTETFAQAVREGSGGAGFDGWTAKELKGLGVSCPSLWDDLVCILNDCVALAAQGACVQCQDQFSWRVVGIPKRCEAAVRPIAIASAIIRAYNRALLPQFPSMPADQYCGAPGRTAATATVAWLATKAYRGAELDLRKAFDSVDHVVASSAARTAGVPEAIIAYLARCVWSAPRHCVVHGEPPAEVIAATTGLPAGDPCSPRLLAFVLEPWSRIVTSFGGIQAFLFMDDRSLTDRLEQGHLAEALEASKWFDTRLGLQEHQGKRQVWDRSLRADCPPVEHLGVFAVPEQHALPEVRVHEDEVCQLADAVARPPRWHGGERTIVAGHCARKNHMGGSLGTGCQFADGEGILPCYAWAVHLVVPG